MAGGDLYGNAGRVEVGWVMEWQVGTDADRSVGFRNVKEF